MNDRCIKYKDVWAAPGSQLHDALTLGQKDKAEAIYQQCEEDARKLLQHAQEQSIAAMKNNLTNE